MNYESLYTEIVKKKSFLCVGLDTDSTKIPRHLLHTKDPVFEFNKEIIDATLPYTVAYKINTAFYEQMGVKGWESLTKTVEYLPSNILIIADAKRGDIGNTSKMYAKAFFETLKCDALTVSPYMGVDSVAPFYEFGKWIIVLAATSNEGANDFQKQKLGMSQSYLYEHVINSFLKFGTKDNTMFVLGATQIGPLIKVRTLAPHHFFLVPGVGTQGGNFEEICNHGMNDKCGLLINSSRQIIYADDSKSFATAAKNEAKKIQEKMSHLL